MVRLNQVLGIWIKRSEVFIGRQVRPDQSLHQTGSASSILFRDNPPSQEPLLGFLDDNNRQIMTVTKPVVTLQRAAPAFRVPAKKDRILSKGLITDYRATSG
jgi:hypothetical protein